MAGPGRIGLACLFLAILPGVVVGQALVLRDLSRPVASIENFDAQGVLLSDQQRIPWRHVLQGDLSNGRQAEFDRWVRERGLPWYRLERRLTQRDWLRAANLARTLNDPGDWLPRERFLRDWALARGHLAEGNRESAVLPLLSARDSLSKLDAKQREAMTEVGWREQDWQDPFRLVLIPVWFDGGAARDAQSAGSRPKKQPNGDVARLYLASLAVAGGDVPGAKAMLDGIGPGASLAEAVRRWLPVIRLQVAIHTDDEPTREEAVRTAAALAAESKGVRRAVVELIPIWARRERFDQSSPEALTGDWLRLMRIAALPSQRHELASAAMWLAAEISDIQERPGEAKILRDELLRTYPDTYHGRMQATAVRSRANRENRIGDQ